MSIIVFVRAFNDIDNVLPIVDYLVRVKAQHVSVYGGREDGYEGARKQLSYMKDILKIDVTSFKDRFISRTGKAALYLVNRIQEIDDPQNKVLKFFLDLCVVNIVRFLHLIAGLSVKSYVKKLPKNTIVMADYGTENQFPYKYLLKFCKKRLIPIIAYSHGHSIFVNTDSYHVKKTILSPKYNKIFQNIFFGRFPKYYYDKYLVGPKQRSTYMSSGNNQGFTAQDNVIELGLPRYTREWLEIFIHGYKTESIKNKFQQYNRVKGPNVTFFLSDNKFNVDENILSDTIDYLVNNKDINFIIKPHTRGMVTRDIPYSKDKSESFYDKYVCDFDSSEIIEWADIGVVYGTSMSIQMLVEGLSIIVPSYIDTNKTIFEESDVGNIAKSLNELKYFISSYDKTANPMNNKSTIDFIRQNVYGGKKSYTELMDDYCY